MLNFSRTQSSKSKRAKAVPTAWDSRVAERRVPTQAKGLDLANIAQMDASMAMSVLNMLPDGMLLLDHDGVVQAANDSFLTLFGFENEALMGQQFVELAAEGELVRLIGLAGLFDGARFSGVPMKIYNASGRSLPISLSGSRLEDEYGLTSGYLMSFHDSREMLRELNGHSRSIAAERDRSTRLEVVADEAEERNQFITETVLKRYVAPSLINDILDGTIAMDKPAELNNVTVLFCDIVGFTRACERLGPVFISNIINEFFTVMSDIIFEYGGTIDKFIGDAIMVMFGAPQEMTPEQQAQCAANCARAMQDAMSALSHMWANDGAEGLMLRIGIHQGEAVVGNFGSYRRMDYTCIGSAVNLAARIESVCAPGAVYMSESVAVHLDTGTTRSVGYFTLKGVEEDQHILKMV
jgi:PAS domain S-box-containing protein